MQNGFLVSGSTLGSGNGGIVEMTAGEPITLADANSRILSGTLQPSDQELTGFARDSPASSKMSSATLFLSQTMPRCVAARGSARTGRSDAGPCQAQRDQRFGRQSLGGCYRLYGR